MEMEIQLNIETPRKKNPMALSAVQPRAEAIPAPQIKQKKKKNEDDSDDDDVISDSTIASLGASVVGQEKQPDNFQMQRLNRMNSSNADGNPATFKKRKIVKSNLRKKTEPSEIL